MTARILAIDPGNEHSAYAVIDADTCYPVEIGKVANQPLRQHLANGTRFAEAHGAIEMVASYGMPVGREVFETCVWIGRFVEVLAQRTGREPTLVYRRDVKLHHCHSPRANDATIRQALVDRFAPGQPNHGKGTTKDPGWFHAFKSDIWQAYALAAYVADKRAGRWR
ncbi:hypothetical protein EII34_14955 [Arachnia propionica]|uniref:Uncharacterized protein n=1 Tax=Arachnia propionica TaxID=1750 RepID=A0A3P1T1H1_9ACTN|nr:hypothetical protein [Arachnia propionica]RRD03204.1 hypothetical protein EII34_14955 [Arachnia propionica]